MYLIRLIFDSIMTLVRGLAPSRRTAVRAAVRFRRAYREARLSDGAYRHHLLYPVAQQLRALGQQRRARPRNAWF